MVGLGTAVTMIAATVSLAGAPGLKAQTASGEAAAPQARAERWSVHGGEQYCLISRVRLEPVANIFSLRMVPGSDEPQLAIPAAAWAGLGYRDRNSASISLDPGGRRFEAFVTGLRVGGDRVALLQGLPPEFIDAFRQARRIVVSRAGREGPDIAFPDPGSAMAAFDQCLAQGLQRWGIDPAVYASLSQRPRLLNED